MVKYILQKQLNCIPCRFIVGVIAPTEDLFNIGPEFVYSFDKLCTVEDILPINDFNPPQSYFEEMGFKPLSTTIVILKDSGAYTDIHHLKRKTEKLESKLNYNINPGAIGKFGICLASHKSTGRRPNIDTYAYGNHPNLLCRNTYYERIMKWDNYLISQDNKFPEYKTEFRVKYFENLINNLPGEAIELL